MTYANKPDVGLEMLLASAQWSNISIKVCVCACGCSTLVSFLKHNLTACYQLLLKYCSDASLL
jgi:hypothetical protein